MLYRSHVLWAGIVAVTVAYHEPTLHQVPDLVLFASGALVGGLLPDVDHPQSKLGRRLPIISHLISLIFKHRGATHSLAFAILTGALAVWYSKPLALGLVLGHLTHLACDSLTDGGIPIFWPWKKRFGWRIIRTGGLAEWLINIAGVVGCWMLVSGGSFDVVRITENLLKNNW